MPASLITGFALGFSLILAIGAQNAFVLRQGLTGKHVFAVALFCALSDALLIAAGIGGLSLLIADFMTAYTDWMFGGAAGLLSDPGRVLGPGLGVEFPHIRRIQSTIHLSRKVWHLCTPRIESTVGHPSSCRTQRYRSLGR